MKKKRKKHTKAGKLIIDQSKRIRTYDVDT